MKQLLWLRHLGYQMVPLEQAIAASEYNSAKSLSITIDDGFANGYGGLLSLMRKHKFYPTLFLIGKCIDNNALAWNHKLILISAYAKRYELDGLIADLIQGATSDTLFSLVSMKEKESITDTLWNAFMPFSQDEYLEENKPFLTAEQLANLVSEGAEIASHSYSHPDFSRLELSQMIDELSGTFGILEAKGLPYKSLFAYPYGLTTDTVSEECLMKEMNLVKVFGTRYSEGDNTLFATRWQRQNIEGNWCRNTAEFIVKPYLRYIKDKYIR